MTNLYDEVSTTFQEPGELVDGELRLELRDCYQGDAAKSWVPAYRFAMTVGAEHVGKTELRLGATDFIVRFAGQVGYEVEANHRRHRFASRALRLLPQLARRHGFTCLSITCEPANSGSRRSCELAGAEMIEIVGAPEDCEMYREGDRQRCRYLLDCMGS